MSSFYIQKEKLGKIPSQVQSVFLKKGFDDVNSFFIHGYQVLAFPKMKGHSVLHLIDGETHLLVSGTCICPKMNILESAKLVLHQFVSEGTVHAGSISGNFILIFFTPSGVQFQTDWSNGLNLYFNHALGIWSDSQLALVAGMHALGCPSNWNKQALREIFVTGSLMGSQTTFEGILRFDVQDSQAGDWKFLGQVTDASLKNKNPGSMDGLINTQISVLQDYFRDVESVIKETGVSCGLTGGMDSRLLLLSIHRFASQVPLSSYTNSRSQTSAQVEIAKKLTKRLNVKWSAPQVSQRAKDPISNLYFNDGILRMYQIWIEELKSRNFCALISGEHHLTMSGVGGEQYRNSEYVCTSQQDFYSWFKLEVIRKYSGKVFFSKRDEDDFIASIKTKVYTKLGLSVDTPWDAFLVKRYFNEIFNPANRLVRNTIENQMGYFLSPFTDYRVAKKAYECVSFLGSSLEFERQMILRMAPDLSDIPLDYGFSPKEKTPLHYRLISTVKKITPSFIMEYVYCRKKGLRFQEEWMKFPQSYEALECVIGMGLNIDINYIMSSELMAPLVIQLGMLDLELRPYLEKK